MRRNPTEHELDDPSVCVVDVGGRHEPERRNFDHHQFPSDHPPICSLSLALQSLGLYQDALKFCDWLKPAEWLDARGPGDTAEWLGVERAVVNQLNSPIDISLLRRFAQETELRPGDALWDLARLVGADLIDFLHSLRARLTFIGENAVVWRVAGAHGPFSALFLPRTDPLPQEPSLGIERYVEEIGQTQTIAALVYPDRRGPGYGLSRFRDHKGVNLTQIADEPDVHFAHKRGFVAKTSAGSSGSASRIAETGPKPAGKSIKRPNRDRIGPSPPPPLQSKAALPPRALAGAERRSKVENFVFKARPSR